MADRLKDKAALVIGAGSIGPGWGNGKATAVAFAREGAKVFCVDVNPAAAEETVAPEVIAIGRAVARERPEIAANPRLPAPVVRRLAAGDLPAAIHSAAPSIERDFETDDVVVV